MAVTLRELKTRLREEFKPVECHPQNFVLDYHGPPDQSGYGAALVTSLVLSHKEKPRSVDLTVTSAQYNFAL